MDGQPTNDAGMEGDQNGGVSGLPSNIDSASQQVIDAKGNRGGRPREDGLVPGSPEAVEADKAKDAERKRLARAAKRNGGQSPDALPSALDGQLPDAPKADAPPAPVVLWKPSHLVRAFKTVVPGIEGWTQQRLLSKASKVPGMPPEMLAEIEADSKWDTDSKDALISSGSELAAKYLNKAGVSSEYGPEVNFASAILAIGAAQLALEAKLEKWAKQGLPGQAVKPASNEPKADAA